MKARVVIFGLLLVAAGALVVIPRTLTFGDLKLRDGQDLRNVILVTLGSSRVIAKWDGGYGTIARGNLPDGTLSDDSAPPPAPQSAKAPVPTPPPRIFQTPWRFESEYIVTEIASDLAEMAYYAKYHKPLDGSAVTAKVVLEAVPRIAAPPRFTVRVPLGADGDVTCIVPLEGAIWAPETYKPLTDALFSKLNLTGTKAVDSTPSNFPHRLLELTAEQLLAADAELSAQLAGAFTSPASHESAALVMAAFVLREPDNIFYQARFGLCRTTAHLAFAEALSGGGVSTNSGKIAKALLTVLYNDEAGAVEQAKALPADADSLAWQRIIRMRATSDYRIFQESGTPTLAERFERLRSHAVLQTEDAWNELHLTEKEAAMADWCRIMGKRPPSVGVGQQLLSQRIPLELLEAKTAYEAETGSSFVAAGYKSLNAEPGRCITADAQGRAVVRVIGWGTWAAFIQRELCAGVSEGYHFLVDWYGDPQQGASFRKKADDAFWELKLYPLVRRQTSAEKDYYHRAQDDAMALVRRSPESAPAEAWNDISESPAGLDRYFPPPTPFINEWHRPNPPPGTAYNLRPRMHQPSLTSRPDYVPLLERLHALAPYDMEIDYHLLYAKYSIYPPPEKIIEVYGSTVDYYDSPCLWIADCSADIPGGYEKWLKKAIALAPGDAKFLATYYANQGRDAEAMTTYEDWMKNETDDVWVANQMEWLVEYKERSGSPNDATALAAKGYDTGSERAMKTKAHLLENRKDFEQAFGIYSEIRESYNDSAPMAGFLMRMKAIGSPSSRDSLLKSLLQSDFPNGLVPAKEDGNVDPPSRGAKVDDPDDASAVTRLHWNDVIVAVNGYRIVDKATFQLVRALNPGAPLKMTVWRDKHYITLPACAGNYVDIFPRLETFGR